MSAGGSERKLCLSKHPHHAAATVQSSEDAGVRLLMVHANRMVWLCGAIAFMKVRRVWYQKPS